MTTSFADLGVARPLVEALARTGITSPFAVQAACIPDALAGRDLCGRAPTGSGKTIAFGVPMLARVGRAAKRRPRALVLAPTRELAAQITRDLTPLAAAVGRRVLAVYGGVGYEPQRRALQRGVDVLVACPGRLADLVQGGAVDLGAIEIVVVDEADRLCDMGFLPQVRRILDLTPTDRQTLLFSATLDGDVATLSHAYQLDPVRHEAGAPEPDGLGAHHVFWNVEPAARPKLTAALLGAVGPTIVFTRTRHGADRLAKQLDRAGVRTHAIHGGRSQAQRDRALASFARGSVQALVATDVAARGIHVDGVACVVHYDKPEDHKAYVHRSGRTARAGAEGTVVAYVNRKDSRDYGRIARHLDLDVVATAPDVDRLSDVLTTAR